MILSRMLKEYAAEFVTIWKCLRELNSHPISMFHLLHFKNCLGTWNFRMVIYKLKSTGSIKFVKITKIFKEI